MRKTVPLGVTLLVLVALLTPVVSAKEASVSLREGLYAEEVEGDLDAAIKIYQQVIDDKAAQKKLVAQALYRQGMCYMKQKNEMEAKAAFSKLVADYGDQTGLIEKIKPLLEELSNADPAALMPPETIAYIEIGSPGKQVETILSMLKGTPFENPLAMIGGNQDQAQSSSGRSTEANIVGALLNPGMMAEFKKIRGMGLGITGMAQNNPPMVLVLFPGKSDALRSIVQMALGFVGQPADAIDGMQCTTIADSAAVAYDDNVVILAQSDKALEQLRWSVRQYKGLSRNPTLASSNKSFATVGRRARQDNALTIWVKPDEAYSGLLKMFPQGEVPPQIRMVNGLVDFANFNDLIASLSLKPTGVVLGANVNLNEGHNFMAFHLAHTPNLSRAALKAVPADAIALVSIGLGQSDTAQAAAASEHIKNAMGLDIGRDLFDNIEQITLFALPFRSPTEQLRDDLPPQAKSIGLAITSANPGQTRELLTKVLRTANLIAGEKPPVAGRYEITLPNNQSLFGYMDQDAKTTVLSVNSDLVERSMAAVKKSRAASGTGPLSDALNALPETTSKLVMVNVAGAIESVTQSLDLPAEGPGQQIRDALAQLAQVSQKTTIQFRTNEETNSFGLQLSLDNLPPIGEMIGPIMQISQSVSEMQSQAESWGAPTTPPATILGTDTAPTVDGKIDNCWARAQAYELKNSFYNPTSSPEDCSASFQVLSDKNNLYVLVEVADDDLQNDSDEYWLDDAVEIFLDADNSKSGSYGDNDYQYHFDWDAASPTMGEAQHDKTDGVKYAFAKTDKGYRLEVQLPWATLGTEAAPGTSIGLDVQVNDDDGGGERDSKLAWNATQDDAWQNPRAIGTAQLAGLVGWWKLDESAGSSASDASGHGHTGTLVGSPQWQPSGGKVGGALEFDGENDYVDTGYGTDFSTWTVGAWIKSPAAPGGGAPTGPIHREKNYQINWNHDEDAFRGGAAVCVESGWYGAGFGSLEGNTWYHLVATYDGENLKAYKNGALVTENSDPSGPPVAEEQTLKFGRHARDEYFFSGTIDDVRIYNYALSETDVEALAAGK